MSFTDSQKLKVLEMFSALSSDLQKVANKGYTDAINIMAQMPLAQPQMPHDSVAANLEAQLRAVVRERDESRAMLDQYNDPTAYRTAADYNKLEAEAVEIKKRWDRTKELRITQSHEAHKRYKELFAENKELRNEIDGFNNASAKLNAEICGLREQLNKAQILLAGADMDKADLLLRVNTLNEIVADRAIKQYGHNVVFKPYSA